MRVHLFSSVHCFKLSWHNRKFTCNLRPGGQITLAPARQGLCRKASSRSIQLYRPVSCLNVPPQPCYLYLSCCLMVVRERREATVTLIQTALMEIIMFSISINWCEGSIWLLDLVLESVQVNSTLLCKVQYTGSGYTCKETKCFMQKFVSFWILAEQNSGLPSVGKADSWWDLKKKKLYFFLLPFLKLKIVLSLNISSTFWCNYS